MAEILVAPLGWLILVPLLLVVGRGLFLLIERHAPSVRLVRRAQRPVAWVAEDERGGHAA